MAENFEKKEKAIKIIRKMFRLTNELESLAESDELKEMVDELIMILADIACEFEISPELWR